MTYIEQIIASEKIWKNINNNEVYISDFNFI